MLNDRKEWVHKGENGKLLIIGGSFNYTGSPILNATAALKSGCDLVYTFTQRRAADTLSKYLPDLITFPYEERFLSKIHIEQINTIIEERRIDTVLFGGGLERNDETKNAILELIQQINKPIVIDADSLRFLSERVDLLDKYKNKIIITPNSNEFETLSKEKLTTNIEDRKMLCKEFAIKLNCTILLKGHIDVVSDGIKSDIIVGGSKYMTKGGFGDILAGITAGIFAQGNLPYETALKAAQISKKAGELACNKFGKSVLASNSLEYINEANNLLRY